MLKQSVKLTAVWAMAVLALLAAVTMVRPAEAADAPGVPKPAVAPADHPAVTMPANSWLEAPNTKMLAVVPPGSKYPKIQGASGPAALMTAWCGAALDSRRSRLMVWGGGHNDYYGNELYAFDIIKLAWDRLTDPTADPKLNREENADGTPQSRHTYGGLAYLAHDDLFFGLGGAIANSGSTTSTAWTYDFAAKKWTNRGKAGPQASYGCTCAYDPATKKLWWFDGGRSDVWSYDVDADKWAKQASAKDSFYYTSAALDSKRGQVVVVGGGRVVGVNVRGEKIVPEVWQTTGGDEFVKQGNVGFAYDSAADKFAGWSKDKVYVLDPEKKAWTASDAPGAPKPTQNGIYGRWRYVPSVNAFVLATGINVNVHFYKLTAGGEVGAGLVPARGAKGN